MNINEVKIWGGWVLFIVVLIVCALITTLAIDSNKNSAFQGIAEACKLEKTEVCNELIKFGVAPELYLSNEGYQKSVDIKAIDAIKRNSAMASSLANFTLNYVGDNKIKLAAKAIQELKILSENSQ